MIVNSWILNELVIKSLLIPSEIKYIFFNENNILCFPFLLFLMPCYVFQVKERTQVKEFNNVT